MKPIKMYTLDVLTYALIASPILLIGILQFEAYNSGFVRAYNGAIKRNVCNDKYSILHETKFKRDLIDKLRFVGDGQSLDQIVDLLKME